VPRPISRGERQLAGDHLTQRGAQVGVGCVGRDGHPVMVVVGQTSTVAGQGAPSSSSRRTVSLIGSTYADTVTSW
jgi:hypothetical protein